MGRFSRYGFRNSGSGTRSNCDLNGVEASGFQLWVDIFTVLSCFDAILGFTILSLGFSAISCLSLFHVVLGCRVLGPGFMVQDSGSRLRMSSLGSFFA